MKSAVLFICLTLATASPWATATVHAADATDASAQVALPSPATPTVEIEGTAGHAKAAYWVIAGRGAVRIREEKLSDISPPLLVENLPDKLSQQNAAIIHVTPVSGAKKYYILKTLPWTEPANVTVTAGKAGDKTFYYWLTVMNGFRVSQTYGPYVVKHAHDANGNLIQWDPVPGATGYGLYRTNTPKAPLGRAYHCIALKLKDTQFKDTGHAYWYPGGEPATAIDQPPVGEGVFLVGVTDGSTPVLDQGQPLEYFIAPSVNETDVHPVTQIADGKLDIRDTTTTRIQSTVNVPNFAQQNFSGGHASALRVDQYAIAGGHSEYHGIPGTQGGWKSWIEAINVNLRSHVASQHTLLRGDLNVYGSGDAVWLHPNLTNYGANFDAGDEGSISYRGGITRGLNAQNFILRSDAKRGNTTLSIGRMKGLFGSGRVVVNLTQKYNAGRISSVDNVVATGKNTQWTADMEGRWISFDVDTTASGYRQWYSIKQVLSSTKLVFRAKTYWTDAANLGYSTYIYDPELEKKNRHHDWRWLEPFRREGARNGGYMIAPASQLGSPYFSKGNLNVEPLREDWHKNDDIQIVAGPNIYMSIGKFVLNGDLLPQDHVREGVSIDNNTSFVANGPALRIGRPDFTNWSTGIELSMAPNALGNGINILYKHDKNLLGDVKLPTNPNWAAIRVPPALPALRGSQVTPWIQFETADDSNPSSLDIKSYGRVPFVRFTQKQMTSNVPLNAHDGITVDRQLQVNGTIQGSDATRGQATFNGDGKTTLFSFHFKRPMTSPPFVLISTNQFATSRLVSVDANGFTVEFQSPPEQGKGNVVIYWMAQL